MPFWLRFTERGIRFQSSIPEQDSEPQEWRLLATREPDIHEDVRVRIKRVPDEVDLEAVLEAARAMFDRLEPLMAPARIGSGHPGHLSPYRLATLHLHLTAAIAALDRLRLGSDGNRVLGIGVERDAAGRSTPAIDDGTCERMALVVRIASSVTRASDRDLLGELGRDRLRRLILARDTSGLEGLVRELAI